LNDNSSDPMTAEFLYYNRWANLRLIDACMELTSDQLARTAPGAYGSIYATLVHIVQAESRYYKRLTGVRLDPSFSWEADPPLSEIRPYAEQVGRALIEVAENMRITDTFPRDWQDPEWEGLGTRFKALGLLIQVVNHGVEHRTNITTILASEGIPTPGLDGWEYMRLNPDRMGA
jgi:uncharacterized damage-inducible protein DinB